MERKEIMQHQIEGHLDYWLVDNEIEICKSDGTIFWTHSSNKSGDFPEWAFKVRDELMKLESEQPLGMTAKTMEQDLDDERSWGPQDDDELLLDELDDEDIKEIDEMCKEMEKLDQQEQENEENEQEIVVCEECGEEIPISEAVELNGNYYCQECAELYEKCDNCGDYHYKDEMTTVAGGDRVCESCLDDYYSYCEECGRYVDNDDMCEVIGQFGDSVWMCEDCRDEKCFYCDGYHKYYMDRYHDSYEVNGCIYSEEYCENNFYWCEQCEEYHRYEDDCEYYEDTDGSGTREYNYNNYRREYHDAPDLHFFGLEDRRRKQKTYSYYTQASIGIELEVDSKKPNGSGAQDCYDTICEITDCDNNEVYFEYDGSLNYGFELITQPHTIESFYAMPWETILRVIRNNGFQSHDIGTCGLHMHISRDFFGSTEEKRKCAITKLIYFYDAFYDEICKVARRSVDKAEQWANKYGFQKWFKSPDMTEKELKKWEIKQCQGIYNARKISSTHSDRYHAVNLTNRNTIEFRIMRGTLNYDSFMACIDFLITIAKNSKKIKYSDINNLNLWFKGMKGETLGYIMDKCGCGNKFTNAAIELFNE